jgi:hypothetical protein
MSYQLKVIKDHPIGFWMLNETSGNSTALDYSGCNNNGSYTGSPATNILPLVPGGGSGTPNTGGGGAAAGGSTNTGGSGGSGIIIVRYTKASIGG